MHMNELYFEIALMLENLAKSYGAPNANYYFRVNGKKPGRDEYRKKVVEYMLHYEHTLQTFAGTPDYEKLESFVRTNLKTLSDQILRGENKEIEKRYSYYMMNEP